MPSRKPRKGGVNMDKKGLSLDGPTRPAIVPEQDKLMSLRAKFNPLTIIYIGLPNRSMN